MRAGPGAFSRQEQPKMPPPLVPRAVSRCRCPDSQERSHGLPGERDVHANGAGGQCEGSLLRASRSCRSFFVGVVIFPCRNTPNACASGGCEPRLCPDPQVNVPVRLSGIDACPGIRKGGTLNFIRRVVPVVSLANAVPPVSWDVSAATCPTSRTGPCRLRIRVLACQCFLSHS